MSLILVNPDWKPKAVRAAKWYLGIGAGFTVLRIIDLLIRRSKAPLRAGKQGLVKVSNIAGLALPVVTWPLNIYNITRNIAQIGVRAIPVIGAFKDQPAPPPATASSATPATAPPNGIKGIGGNYY